MPAPSLVAGVFDRGENLDAEWLLGKRCGMAKRAARGGARTVPRSCGC